MTRQQMTVGWLGLGLLIANVLDGPFRSVLHIIGGAHGPAANPSAMVTTNPAASVNGQDPLEPHQHARHHHRAGTPGSVSV